MRIWTPCPSYEPEEVELWLNERAAEGKKLKKWGSIFVTLEDEEEKGYQYYLDADDGRLEPNQERRTENEEKGWKYVCSPWEHIHIYRAAAGCGRPVVSQELRLKRNRKFRNYSLLITAWWILYPALILGMLLPKKFILLEFMGANWRSAMFVLLFIPVILYSNVWNIRRTWKIYAWLKGSDGGRNMKKKRRIKSGQITAVQIAFCTALILFVLGSDKKHYVNIGEAYPSVPFVDLQEISGDGFQVSEFRDQEYPGINICNSIQMEPAVFAWEHYITFQDGQNQDSQNQDGRDEAGRDMDESRADSDEVGEDAGDSRAATSASLTGTYWKIEQGLISNTLFSQLVSRYTEYEWYRGMFRTVKKAEAGWLTEKKEDPRFLSLVTAAPDKETNWRKDTALVFAQTEEYVVYLNYSGELTAAELVEALAESLGR